MIAFPLALLALQTQSGCCGMNTFANDPSFLAAHFTPMKTKLADLKGTMVTIHDVLRAPQFQAYWVAPAHGNHSAVVMVHEFWGLNDNIRLTADKLSGQTGYGVLAIDLYDGRVADDPKTAGALMQSVDPEVAKKRVAAAVRALKTGVFGGFMAAKVGSIGYCFGGGWSFETAVQGGADVNACVVYYGMPDTAPEALARLRAPVLFFQGERDKWINDQVTGEMVKSMGVAGRKVKLVKYDADHAFANPSNAHYDKAATADAWKRMTTFFKTYLGP